MIAPLRTVLFDLDGTLIDSVRLILDSYHHTLATHGLPARSDADWLRGLGTPLTVQLGEWATDPPLLERMIATYRDYNISNHDARVTAYPGILEMIRTLRDWDIGMGLVTSKNRVGANRGLDLIGLTPFMDVVIGADDVTNPKPHGEPVELAVSRLGAAVEHAIYVGDSVHDMEAGRAAGVRTAAVLWGPFTHADLAPTMPDYWLENPADLLALVRPLT